ncbi:hypothetical protein F5888DRAFT_1906697 [Russula emetica]|nr:hypothetical protein F5888DRAFT_1906697 [Russula emetica]
MLTSLETLQLQFDSHQSFPDPESRRPPSLTHFVLPALTFFWFKGVNKYLGELVARIDAPQLYRLSTSFFNFKPPGPDLNQFISRTPTLGAYNEAHLMLNSRQALVRLRQSQPEPSDHDGMAEVNILSLEPDRQLSPLAQTCTLSLRLLLTMDNLYIFGDLNSPLAWEYNTKILDLLLLFTAVKNLYLSETFSRCIACALQELTRPSEPVRPGQEGIAQFISARQLTNNPVAISVWVRDPIIVSIVSIKSASAESNAEPQIKVKVIRTITALQHVPNGWKGPGSLAEAFLGTHKTNPQLWEKRKTITEPTELSHGLPIYRVDTLSFRTVKQPSLHGDCFD